MDKSAGKLFEDEEAVEDSDVRDIEGPVHRGDHASWASIRGAKRFPSRGGCFCSSLCVRGRIAATRDRRASAPQEPARVD